MNTIDVVILIIMGYFAFRGMFRGVVLELLTLVGMLAGYIVALKEMSRLSGFILSMIPLPEVLANALGFLICFVGILLLFRWIANMFKHAIKGTALRSIDHAGGLCIGLIKGAILVSVLALLINLLPLPQSLDRPRKESLLYEPALTVAPFAYNLIGRVFPYTKDFYKKWQAGIGKKTDEIKEKIITDQIENIPNSLIQSTQMDSLLKEMDDARAKLK